MQPIEIFRAGNHTTMAGETIAYTAADVAAMAAAYDPARFDAPVVIGHPALNAPAYGWVKALRAEGDLLRAEIHQVEPAFADAVAAGRYKKVSASFFKPDAKGNPTPGQWSLRHVGFLGAAAPAVKGLKPVQFAADDDGVVEFADYSASTVATMFRGLRDWMLTKFGQDEADKVLPDYYVSELQNAAAREIPTYADPTFQTGDATVKTPEQIAAEAKLAEDRKQFDAEKAAFAERAGKGRRDDFAAFLKTIPDRVTPALAPRALALFAALDGGDAVEFAEGERTVKAEPGQLLRDFLAGLPKVVDLAERAGGTGDTVDLADAQSIADAARELVDAEAKAGRAMSYSAAVQRVTKGK